MYLPSLKLENWPGFCLENAVDNTKRDSYTTARVNDSRFPRCIVHRLSPTSLRLALTIAAQRGYSFRSCDIKTAFLYANLPQNTHLFAEIPQGHPAYDQRETTVLQVKRALYGLRESPLLWYNHLINFMRSELRFQQSIYDECFLFKGNSDLLVLVYVDDILILGTTNEVQQATRAIGKRFEITKSELNCEVDFLGCAISRSPNGEYKLSQVKYAQGIVDTFARNLPTKLTPLPATITPLSTTAKYSTLNTAKYWGNLDIYVSLAWTCYTLFTQSRR